MSRATNIDGALLTRSYLDLRGVDFSNDETQVVKSRSPYAINVWKDYNSSLGQAIETRPGLRSIKRFPSVTNLDIEYRAKILKIHAFSTNGTKRFVAHVLQYDTASATYKGKLYEWTNFPTEEAVFAEIEDNESNEVFVGTEVSVGFNFDGSYYFMDGTHYYVFVVNNTALCLREVEGYVPTTYIFSKNGESTEYQDYNLITGSQKHEYKGNGTRTEFVLLPVNAEEITISSVTIDGTATTAYTASLSGAIKKITFSTAPADDSVVVVEFTQAVTNYIKLCKKAIVFDNRVFVAGGVNKTAFYFSALNNASYFPATNFEYAGKDELNIVDLVIMSTSFALIKEGYGGKGGYLYNISGVATGDEIMPKAYKAELIGSSIGGVGGALNFKNDIVFLSKYGLSAITQLDLHNERNIAHRSTMVDGKLKNENDLSTARMTAFRDYLIITVNGRAYLADSRQTYKDYETEYEWYYWENFGIFENDTLYKATDICESADKLYVGTENGCILVLNTDKLKTADDGTTTLGTGELLSSAYADDCYNTVLETLTKQAKVIYSCWCTPVDDFGYRNRFKRCNKKGALADLKSFAHSICKLSIKTDDGFYSDLTSHNGGYFDFSDLDFEDFTFNTSDKNVFYYSAKNKKWARLSLKFYSNELYKPFGIFGATMEAYVMGYAKEREE